MKKLSFLLITYFILLLPSFVMSDTHSKDNKANSSKSVYQKIKDEKRGKSVLEFTTLSTLNDVTKTFSCQIYNARMNTLFKNSTDDWITHKCEKGDIKLVLQVRNNDRLSVIQAYYPQNKIILNENLNKVLNLIGKPNQIENFKGELGNNRRLVSYNWGQWGKYDDYDIESFPANFFQVRLSDFKNDENKYLVRKTLVNNQKFRNNMTFNPSIIWNGVYSVINWLLYFIVWWFVFQYYSNKLQDKKILGYGWNLRRKQLYSIFNIFLVCALISFIIGQGGETCLYRDMFGCAEYSGEYIEPWSWKSNLEFFVKLFGISLFAWIMANKGHKII